MPNLKKLRSPCLVCGKEPYRAGYKYCSNACQQEFQYRRYVALWKNGEETGLIAMGVVSFPVKRYLREKYFDKCCLCGWSQVNPITNKVPLVADHVDGNWRNNTEDNLRLICPNCDSLTTTYAALNKGNGRGKRAPSKRLLTARILFGRKTCTA
jgi:predicted nucleic acid-binding Zn ribbon protein